MSWDDDDDAFYAAVDWEAQVRQAERTRQQAPAAAWPQPLPQQARPQQPQQQQQHPPGQPAAGLRSLFTAGAGPGSGGAGGQPNQQPGAQQQGSRPQPLPPQQQQRPAPSSNAPGHVQHRQQLGNVPGPHSRPAASSGGAPFPQQPYSGPPQQQRPYGGPQQQPPYGQQQGGPPQQRPYGAQPLPQQPYGQLPPQQQQNGQQQRAAVGSPGSAAGSAYQGPASGPASGHQGAGSGHMASSGQGAGPLMYVSLELGKDSMIEVKCGTHEAISAALKRLPGGSWDSKSRHWRFPIAQHDRLVQILQSLSSVRVRLEPLHPLVAAVLRASAASSDDSDRYAVIPSALEVQLMPFQREGVKFALRHSGRALIGDEMGLGKTVQAIAVASAYKDEWPLLIIAPSSLREAWADALHRWLGLTEDKMHIVNSGKDATSVPKGIQCLIISYNFVQKMDLHKKYNVVICDECHFIKDGAAQRTKATVPLIKDARRAILLSGTPALNKPKEIFQQLAALVPAAKLKMKDFGERYCQGNFFDKYGGASNLAELNAVLKNSVMVRRLKRDVLTQLPSKRRQQVILCLDADAKKQLAGLQKQLDVVRQLVGEEARKSAASGSSAGASSMAQNSAIGELYKKTSEVKAKAVQEYVQLLLDNGQKFLVFAHHTSLLDAIEHTCNRHKGCQHIRIDGSTPPSTRQGLVNKFQENADVRVAILSIKAAGTGLTLTAASTVVFAEMTWTPGEIIQAEDRAHRIGQANSVNVYFLHAKGSSDDLIWNSLEKKLDTVGEAIDGQGQALHAKRTEAPERGQLALQPFLSQRPGQGEAAALAPAAVAQQQQQQAGGASASGGAGRPAASSGGVKSPGKEKQSSLLKFFHSDRGQQPPQQQQQQQQQQGMGLPHPGAHPQPQQQAQQQAQQHSMGVPGGHQPPPQQRMGQMLPPGGYGQQQQQGPPPGPYHQQQPGLPPGHNQQQQQQQQRQQPPAENAGPPQGWQQQPGQYGGAAPPALHGPSGAANVQRGVGGKVGALPGVAGQPPPGQPPQLAGMKRPYCAS